ncbi:MAG: methylated-DNA--[protein]-cysteine S-methyltransferase [Planctomycetaceae bacterium]|nr:methylated-DNA--[protein]-cysteine S-methyltransferase [Planctomycetaceae bacterium]
MQTHYYSVFKTKWGWFGLLATDDGLVRACLPQQDKKAVITELLDGVKGATTAKYRLIEAENAVKDYYRGVRVDFSDLKVDLADMTDFQQKVLGRLRNVEHGQTTTYGKLAEAAGAKGAARAIGGCMAKNPLPLILPCHRVMGTSGSLTGFSGPGGVQTKKRMLELERQGS